MDSEHSEPLFRPPAEAYTLILRVAYGCPIPSALSAQINLLTASGDDMVRKLFIPPTQHGNEDKHPSA